MHRCSAVLVCLLVYAYVYVYVQLYSGLYICMHMCVHAYTHRIRIYRMPRFYCSATYHATVAHANS